MCVALHWLLASPVSRSDLPDMGPVSSPVQNCPNYKAHTSRSLPVGVYRSACDQELAEDNPYRKALLDFIFAEQDERLVFNAEALLVCLLQVRRCSCPRTSPPSPNDFPPVCISLIGSRQLPRGCCCCRTSKPIPTSSHAPAFVRSTTRARCAC